MANRHAPVPPVRKRALEVRSALTRGRIARVLFCVREGQMVLLHAFVKKTQRTPPADITLALRRMKDLA
jgi:phage-related protein